MKFKKILFALLASIALGAYSASIDSYIRPPQSNLINAPLPSLSDPDQILGIYGNILYPEDRELIQKKRLFDWIGSEAPFPLTEEEMREISFYVLDRFPKETFRWHFAKEVERQLEKGEPLERALEKAEAESLNQAEFYKQLAQRLPLWKGACERLSQKFEECAESYASIVKEEIKILRKGPIKKTLASLLRSTSPSLIQAPYHWDTRIGVLKQTIDKITSLSPNSPYFLALQEVTPQALHDLKKIFAEKKLQWISFNHISGNPTLGPREETVPGEAAAFTSTVALSSELKTLKVDLGDLPTESGSPRKILAVRVLHPKTNKTFDLFTTHTDHKIQNDLYARTAIKIHQFVTHFLEDAPLKEQQPFLIGGDLNAFPQSGGDRYVATLREFFPDSQDFRESNYYAPSPIAWSTFIGRPHGYPPLNVAKDGTVEPNGLDQLLLNHLQIDSSSREALVYNESGELLDYYEQKKEYVQQLRSKVTFSDHFFNIVRFKMGWQPLTIDSSIEADSYSRRLQEG